MGGCLSGPSSLNLEDGGQFDVTQTRASQLAEINRSKQIDLEHKTYKEQEMKESKLLLLGAGESGKSTLFKQLVSIYQGDKKMSQMQLNQFIPTIHQTCITSMLTLIEQSELMNEEYDTDVTDYALNASKQFLINEFDPNEDTLTEEAAKHIKLLWNDRGIQKTYSLRGKFQLLDNCSYYFDNIERICNPNYEPSFKDVIMCRVRSTGISETRFKVNGHRFLLVDVGGQRNERRKWIHCFDKVTAVLFVAALSEYDQVLLEDYHQNRMLETLKVFRDIAMGEVFLKVPIILFLNKRDLFAQKVDKVPIHDFFPEYKEFSNSTARDSIDSTGLQAEIERGEFKSTEFEHGLKFFYQKFADTLVPREPDEPKREGNIFLHITCATDTENIRRVFEDVKSIFINRKLEEIGLLS